MKDIMLKITGKQFSGEEAEEHMEFITEGKLYQKGESKYLIYDESEFSGFPGCKTTLKLTGNQIRLKRVGKNVATAARWCLKRESVFRASIRRLTAIWIWRC